MPETIEQLSDAPELQGAYPLANDSLNTYKGLRVGDSLPISPLGPDGPRIQCQIQSMRDFGFYRVFRAEYRNGAGGYYTLRFEIYPECPDKNICVILGSPEPLTSHQSNHS